jgi:crotonobetaine/carnitine-CoA ligase
MTPHQGTATHRKSRELVFHYLVEERARRTPDKVCLVMNNRRLTYAEIDAEANRWARGLQNRGVRKGDRVLVMIPSGIEHVLIWLGLCKLGALMVPVNEAYKGNMLKHQVNDSAAELAIVDERHLPHWRDLQGDLLSLKAVAVYPDRTVAAQEAASWDFLSVRELRSEDASGLPPAVEYFDPMAIFYTSGTTGPSKGVLYSYAQAHATAALTADLCDPDDVFYMFLPMFHVGLSNMFGLVAIAGATMAIREKFSASQFWPDVRRYGASMTILLSTMPNFLLSQPENPGDRDHGLRKVIVIPLLKELEAFKARFGCEVTTFYNMTEVSMPLRAEGFRLANAMSCGRPRPGITARIVDEKDEPVPAGEVGELVLRADNPWEFNLGYWRNPDKTVESWRNQWLHTGDTFRVDREGNYYFVDRLKDAIRRRGENISSYEVEAEVDAHPAILESAAVAVPSPAGEDEVKVVATLKPGADLEPAELHAFLRGRLPSYMVPQFIDLRREELPKTPTGKIRKAALREEGPAKAWALDDERTSRESDAVRSALHSTTGRS